MLGQALGLLSSEDNWLQHKKKDRAPDGTRRYSLQGAMEKVSGPIRGLGSAVRRCAVLNVVCAAIGEQDVAKWNDELGRRYEDVVVALRRAIQLAPFWVQYGPKPDRRTGLTLEVRSESRSFEVMLPRGRLALRLKDETGRIISTLFSDTRSSESAYLEVPESKRG